MMPEDWREVERLFHAALELQPDQRARFLAEACKNLELREKVESLLKHRDSGNRFDRPAIEVAADMVTGNQSIALIGQTIDHYEVLSLIGKGGMGEVYRARDTRLNRTVALKLMASASTGDAQSHSRFLREARLAATLDHPNICTIFDVGESKERLFIAMQYVEGRSLREMIDGRPLDTDALLAIANQVSNALAAAHRRDIIHRDVKPENIIVTPAGEAKVLDFGLARLAQDADPNLTRSDCLVGTPAYMSPEQALGERVDHRSDVFSFGVVLYEMATGRAPFRKDSSVETMHAIIDQPHPPVQDLNSKTPGDLIRIIDRTLRKTPSERYATFDEVSAELRRVATGHVATSRRAARTLWRPALAIPALLLLAIGVAFWIRGATRAQWVRNEAIPQIEQLLEQDHVMAAYDLANEAEGYLPGDRNLRDLLAVMSTTVTPVVTSDGADIYFKEYSSTENTWRYLGRSPLNDIRMPRVNLQWKVEKAGFSTLELATPSVDGKIEFPPLTASSGPPSGMVLVPSTDNPVGISGFGRDAVHLGSFSIDRYEVTNRQFKEFVDSGGYQSPQYWTQPVVKEGRVLPWKEAMMEFHDTTGYPGPSTWELGEYPKGQDDYPVGGVSWYEAAAYANFRGKRLPTLFHWSRAALFNAGLTSAIAKASNVAGQGLAAVGTHAGIGRFGTYDTTGNVREWCWNADGDHRWVLGGAWNDARYMANLPYSLPPFDRSPQNGIRLAQYPEEPAEQFLQPVEVPHYDLRAAKPVSDEVFEVFRRQYSRIPSELNSKVELRDESENAWVREKVTFDAGYNGERMTVYLFLPRRFNPPHEAVIFFPGRDVFDYHVSSNALQPGYFEFIVKSGRALVMPVFSGSYERERGAFLVDGEERLRFMRELMNHWRQDLGRTIDYLQTRHEIDAASVAYLGVSLGASLPVALLNLENRIKAAVLFSGGLPLRAVPPETDPLNYLPRIRIPFLMISGSFDYLYPVEGNQQPMMSLLGSDPMHKRHVLLEGGHGPGQLPRGPAIKEALSWLDRYLGPVK